MNCLPDKVKDYFFGELEETERADVRAHLDQCRACREECDRLRLTQAALKSIPDEDPPRRTAFVSDKVFEPSWWQRFWASAPRLGFASAALLALAIIVNAAWRPAPVLAVDQRAIEARVSAEVQRRLQPAIQAAVSQAEARQERKTAEIVAAARKDFEFQQQADRVAIQDVLRQVERKLILANRLAYNADGGRQ